MNALSLRPRHRFLVDGWYAKQLGCAASLDDMIASKVPKWLASRAVRSGVVRDILFFWLGREFDLLVVSWGGRGRWLLIILEAFRRSRRLAMLEFIPFAYTGSPMRQRLTRIRDWFVVRPLLRLSACKAHVLSTHEIGLYSRHFRMPIECFHYLGWPMSRNGDQLPDFVGRFESEPMVLVSGRMYVDWETLFAAAKGAGWKLVVVCGQAELAMVSELAKTVDAVVHAEISAETHARLLARCWVYVISLQNVEFSVGQIRVMNAVRAGAPLVVSRVPGVLDYLEDNKSAMLYAQGCKQSLRAAVDALVTSSTEGERLAREAWCRAQFRSFESYLEGIGRWLEKTPAVTG